MSMSFVNIHRSIYTSEYFNKKIDIDSDNVELDFTGKLNGTNYWFEFKSVKPTSPAGRNNKAKAIRKQIETRFRLLKRLGPKKTKLILVLKYGLGEAHHKSFLELGADQVIALDTKLPESSL